MNGTLLQPSYELVVIGAGPAGMAAATVAARAGIATLVLDEQPSPGGQIYRAVTETPVRQRSVLGDEYWQGAALVRDFQACGATYVPEATVWSLSREREIGVSIGGRSQLVRAARVVIATGALERPMPVPGWTLPGVMSVGAAQILLKASGLTAKGRIVLAGNGPLLWLLAAQYRRAGAAIEAILETTPDGAWRTAMPYLPGFLASAYFRKGARLMLEVRRHARVVPQVVELAAAGDGQLRDVVYRTARADAPQRLAADTLLLHQGVVPNVNLAMSVGIEHRWDEEMLCFRPVLDGFGNSAVEGIAVAGDGAGIAGAEAAADRGRLAGFAAVRALRLGVADVGPEEARLLRLLAESHRGRRFVDLLYRAPDRFRVPAGDTLVCRCEEVTAQQVLDTVALDCSGPNQMKAFLRCGMGPCQGRLCGLTVSELLARARGVPPQEVGYYRLRPPVKPITLAELGGLPAEEASVKAVIRG